MYNVIRVHVTDDYAPEKLSIMIITDLDIQTEFNRRNSDLQSWNCVQLTCEYNVTEPPKYYSSSSGLISNIRRVLRRAKMSTTLS